MRIAVFSDGRTARDPGGRFGTNDAFPKLLQRVLRDDVAFTLATRCVDVAEPVDSMFTTFDPDDPVRFVPLPYFAGNADAVRRLPTLVRATRPIARRTIEEADVVLLRFPFALSSLVVREARRSGRPIVGYWAGAPLADTADQAYRGAGRLLRFSARARASWLDHRTADQAATLAWNLLTDAADPRFASLINATDVTPSLITEDEIVGRIPDRPADVPLRVVYAGRLVRAKGVLDLLDAMRSLPAPERYELHLIGDGPLRAEVERVATGLPCPVTVHGAMPHDTLLDRLRRAHVMALPSYAEGSPKILIEAWASGCAVVSTDVNGLATLLHDDDDALVHRPGEPAQLAACLRRLESDEPLRRRLAEAGRRRAMSSTHAAWSDEVLGACRRAIASPPASLSTT